MGGHPEGAVALLEELEVEEGDEAEEDGERREPEENGERVEEVEEEAFGLAEEEHEREGPGGAAEEQHEVVVHLEVPDLPVSLLLAADAQVGHAHQVLGDAHDEQQDLQDGHPST